MNYDEYNIFLIHKYSGAIIYEIFNSKIIFSGGFLKICKSFKHVICKNNKFNLLDCIITNGLNSKKIIFIIFSFFDLKFKYLLFPFYFTFEIYNSNSYKLIDRMKAKFFEILLNIFLIFM